jgi:alkylation response protein AidB-like acyl-CoA dehydrogenase
VSLATVAAAFAPSDEELRIRETVAAIAEAGVKCVDRAIQAHGGNGVALEYGLADLSWGVRTAKVAPVSRAMILNYVAEHSLRLPRSY